MAQNDGGPKLEEVEAPPLGTDDLSPEAVSGDASTERSSPDELDNLSHQFSARIEGLRELLEVISPHVAVLDSPEGFESTIDQSGLSVRGKTVLRDLFVSGLNVEIESGTKSDDSPEPAREQTPETDDELVPVPLDEAPREIREFVDLATEEPRGVSKVLRRVTQSLIAPRASLLHGSLLTVAVASFEFLVAGLFSHHLITYPRQLKDDEREFSLADLVELGSIEEARRVLVERRVDNFMRRSIDDWSRWSKQTLGEAFDQLCVDFAHLNEVFLRRHAVVHSGGVVNRLYLERVDLQGEERPELGQDLPVSASYMQSALDELEVLGHGLIGLARSKWTPSNPEKASDYLNGKIFDLLQAQRWKLARKLAVVGESLGQPDSDRWMITVNGWLAAKRLEEFEVCSDQVVNWDVSALANQFKLARACLLDEIDEAFDLLATILAEPERKPGHIWGWPLLDDLRPDSRFIKVFVDAGYSPDDHQDSSEPGQEESSSPDDPSEKVQSSSGQQNGD
jgi:hypothetical protein